MTDLADQFWLIENVFPSSFTAFSQSGQLTSVTYPSVPL